MMNRVQNINLLITLIVFLCGIGIVMIAKSDLKQSKTNNDKFLYGRGAGYLIVGTGMIIFAIYLILFFK